MVDKRPIGYIPGQVYFLDKKPLKNKKYAHIGPTINTGLHANNIKIMSDKALANRRGEHFKRIKPSTLANLMKKERHFENVYNMITEAEAQSVSMMISNKQKSPRSKNSHHYEDNSDRLSNSQVSVVTYNTEQLGFNANTEYVVVDLRERDEYEKYHIQEALHFPGPGILRDNYPSQILNLKNKEDKFVILYHQDEKHGIPYANELYEKGYDNVYLISGGIEAFLEDVPELVEGKEVPTVSPLKKGKGNSSIVYKRSKYLEYPDEGDVVIPSNYMVDDSKSMFSAKLSDIRSVKSFKPNNGGSFVSKSKSVKGLAKIL